MRQRKFQKEHTPWVNSGVKQLRRWRQQKCGLKFENIDFFAIISLPLASIY